jgi:hypothetical protein
MSVRKRGKQFEVRWAEGGRKLSRSFLRAEDARAFDVDIKRRKQLGALAPGIIQSRQTLAQFVEEEWRPRYAIPSLAAASGHPQARGRARAHSGESSAACRQAQAEADTASAAALASDGRADPREHAPAADQDRSGGGSRQAAAPRVRDFRRISTGSAARRAHRLDAALRRFAPDRGPRLHVGRPARPHVPRPRDEVCGTN